MNRPRISIVLTVAAIVFALGAGGYYYVAYYYVPQKEAQLTMTSLTQSKPAIQDLYSGHYDSAIDTLRTLIKQAPTKNEQARLQELLMAGLFDTGNEKDTAEGASIAYTIVNDYSVPAWVRALAFNTISRVVLAHDLTFYKTYFNKSPFSGYLGTSGTDTVRVRDADLKMLQVSDEIYPTSFAEYGIAGLYTGMLIYNNIPAQQTPQDIANLAQKYVEEGDTRDDYSLYAPYSVILNQLFRARAIAVSSRILKNHSPEEVEPAYKRVNMVVDSLQSTGADLDTPKVQAVLLTWRFSYADFLLTFFGESRTSDIKTLLEPFATRATPEVISLLEKGGLGEIGHLPATDPVLVKALKLAAVSPEFKAFLVRMGVSF
jgi:hypothetical protein